MIMPPPPSPAPNQYFMTTLSDGFETFHLHIVSHHDDEIHAQAWTKGLD